MSRARATLAADLARNSTPEALAARRTEVRASTLATRRARAAEALGALGMVASAEHLRALEGTALACEMAAVRRALHLRADEGSPGATRALDALGLLWAALPEVRS